MLVEFAVANGLQDIADSTTAQAVCTTASPEPAAADADRRLREFQAACRELDEQIAEFLTRLEASQTSEEMAELRILRRVYGAASFLRELVSWRDAPGRPKTFTDEEQQELDRLIQRSRELEGWTGTLSQT